MSDHRIGSVDELRRLYREPSARVQSKKASTIGPRTEARLAASPFVLLATSSSDGSCDVSPRGGPPGMVLAVDATTVALPDLGGNNLIDSLTNIVGNPHAGLLVLNPPSDETVRIDGRAHLSTDPELLARWDGLVRRPKLAVVIEVDNVFIHCAKAFRRSGLWDPATWPSDVVDACDLLLEHIDAPPSETTEAAVNGIRAALEDDYARALADEAPPS